MKHALMAAPLSGFLMLSAPALADPALGFGISFVSTGEVAIGFRVFADNQASRGTLAVGLDYKLESESLRPTIGAAWLEDDYYADLSVGYDSGSNRIDFGAGIGLAGNTWRPAPPPPPPAGGGGGGTDATRPAGGALSGLALSF